MKKKRQRKTKKKKRITKVELYIKVCLKLKNSLMNKKGLQSTGKE